MSYVEYLLIGHVKNELQAAKIWILLEFLSLLAISRMHFSLYFHIRFGAEIMGKYGNEFFSIFMAGFRLFLRIPVLVVLLADMQ